MPPTRLTRALIVETAFEVLDEVGIDGLTVRVLAAKLGVKAPALYWHLDSKQALLDAMGTEIAARINAALDDAEGAEEDANLAAALRTYAHTMRTEYLRHRDGARTFSGTRLTDPTQLNRQEPLLARWVERGYTVEELTDRFEVVTAWVVGFVIEEQERTQSTPDRYDLATRDAAVGDDSPLTTASGHHLYRPADQKFAEQLDLILTGLTPSPR